MDRRGSPYAWGTTASHPVVSPHSPMQDPSQAGAESFQRACSALSHIAQINSAAVDACLGWYNDQPDAEAAAMVCSSMAFALAQLQQLATPMVLLALSLEEANAAAERQAVE